MIKYYRTTQEKYEQARISIDISLGYPSLETDTIWCPVSYSPKDVHGRCLLALWEELYSLPSVLKELNNFEEISEDEYRSNLPNYI